MHVTRYNARDGARTVHNITRDSSSKIIDFRDDESEKPRKVHRLRANIVDFGDS